MADYFPGEITIGGRIPTALVADFVGEVASAGGKVGGFGDEGHDFNAKNTEELLALLDENGHLVLSDDQARYGMFEELESFCATRHSL